MGSWNLDTFAIYINISGRQTWMRQGHWQKRTRTQGYWYQAIAREHCRIQVELRDHGRCRTSFPQDQNHGQHPKVLLFDLLHWISPWPKQSCQGWYHWWRQKSLLFDRRQRYLFRVYSGFEFLVLRIQPVLRLFSLKQAKFLKFGTKLAYQTHILKIWNLCCLHNINGNSKIVHTLTFFWICNPWIIKFLLIWKKQGFQIVFMRVWSMSFFPQFKTLAFTN